MAGVASVALGVDGSCATPVVAAVLLFDLALPRLLPPVRIVLLFCVVAVGFWFAGSWALTSRSKVAKTTAKATVIRSTIEREIFSPMNHLLPYMSCAQLYVAIAHVNSNVWGIHKQVGTVILYHSMGQYLNQLGETRGEYSKNVSNLVRGENKLSDVWTWVIQTCP
jgi:hypothetical protein